MAPLTHDRLTERDIADFGWKGEFVPAKDYDAVVERLERAEAALSDVYALASVNNGCIDANLVREIGKFLAGGVST